MELAMKKTTRIIFAAVVIVILASMLSGCTAINQYIKVLETTYKAEECIAGFVEELSAGDIEEAKQYLHPDSTPSADELEDYINEIKANNDFSLTEEVTFKEFGDISSNATEERITYNLSIVLTQADENITLNVSILSDDKGLGIYSIDVE